MNKMLDKSGYELHVNKPLCKNLQNIERNPNEKFDVRATELDFWLIV